MAGSQQILPMTVCVLLVFALVADSANASGVCSANALWPCLSAIEGAHPPAPSRQCCDVVKQVDKVCMCNQFKSSSFPKQMLKNGLELPKKCGRFDLRGFRCGAYMFPY